jgi:hypothetical protein
MEGAFMYGNYLAMVFVIFLAVLLLFIFVKKSQIRTALLGVFVAQLFSWPITLLYVQIGIQENPVRLFPHATQSNFLFAFIFFPCVFAAYYLHYPKNAKKHRRILYSFIVVALSVLFHTGMSLISDLVHVPNKWVLPFTYAINLFLYNISRVYIDRYLDKRSPARAE